LLYALSVKEIIRNQPFDIIIKDAVKEIQKEEMYWWNQDNQEITNWIHESACKVFRKRVFPTMRDDSILRVIRYDELAIDYGNKLCEKF